MKSMRPFVWGDAVRALLLLFALVFGASAWAFERSPPGLRSEIAATALPPEARYTLATIHQGGPFPYRKDGVAFQNRERHLLQQRRQYYREYTVVTPGSRDRGARRIIAGAGKTDDVRSSGEYYYTDDHYRSFRRIRE